MRNVPTINSQKSPTRRKQEVSGAARWMDQVEQKIGNRGVLFVSPFTESFRLKMFDLLPYDTTACPFPSKSLNAHLFVKI